VNSHQREVRAVCHLEADHVERGRDHDEGHDPDEERHVRNWPCKWDPPISQMTSGRNR
jgi:hypothetical protein